MKNVSASCIIVYAVCVCVGGVITEYITPLECEHLWTIINLRKTQADKCAHK